MTEREGSPEAPAITTAAPAVNEATGSEAATTAPTSSRRGRVRLDRLAHVRRQLGAVYRDLAAWNPPTLRPAEKIARARCLGLLLGQVSEVVRHSDLEARLAALESLVRGGGDPN